ncbi:DNA polymerase III subunit gamma/tau [Virgibacillus sp. DJP39]|uniref:DNA polymerase III subunit gamma/tau n=1 Tax=Virgibacillus sp. DJP39 TaxID=3409790 RepID=UPI003BB736F3
MSYQALYRVWRPRNFTDVVGQSHITRTLQNAIEQEKFSHAYLFSGPRGTGKTSAAKIFAKTINCEKAPVREPCNECDACRGIQDGSISDIIEMDAASHTSVEDIREIRDKVKYASSVVPYKVYIIDEVHMISVNAFNALLKTLEEPPKHVVFILATTEPHKIPLTIISRCQRFDFKPISSKAIVDRMHTILDQEKVSVSSDALETVALAAEGGMRDALSILDQAISYSGDSVTLQDVLAVTGGVSQQVLTDIVQEMYKQDVQKALKLLDEIVQNGKDPGRFVFDLIYFLRDLMLYQSAPSLEGILERAIIDEAFKELAKLVTVDWIRNAIMELNQCQQEIKWSNSPKVFIEIAVLSLSKSDTKQSESTESVKATVSDEALQKLSDKVEILEKELQKWKNAAPAPNAAAPAEKPRRAQSRASKNSYKTPYEKIRHVLQSAEKVSLKQVQSEWGSFLSALKKANAPAHATIQDSKPAAASDTALVVAFKYEIHCSLFLDNRETVEAVLTKSIGKELTIIPIPENNWQELRNEYINKQEETTNQEEQETTADPLIDEARKLVGDDLLEIHD